ncbi:MAG: hypothetical protein V4560_12185 [Bacteroidota bacterium]
MLLYVIRMAFVIIMIFIFLQGIVARILHGANNDDFISSTNL